MIPHALQLPCTQCHSPNYNFEVWLLGNHGSGEELRGYQFRCACGKDQMLVMTESELRRQNKTDGDEGVEYTEYSAPPVAAAVAPEHDGVILGEIEFSPEDNLWMKEFQTMAI